MEVSGLGPLSASSLITGQDSLGSLWSSTAALDSSSSLMGVLNALRATGSGSDLSSLPGLELLPNSVNPEFNSAISKNSPAHPSAATSNFNNLSLFSQPASLRSLSSNSAVDPLTGISESAALVEAGNIEITTPDSNIVQNRMVFSTVNEEVRAEKTLTVKNTGTGDLTITGLSFGNGEILSEADFRIVNSPTTFTLAPDASQNISVQFAPKGIDKVSSLNANDSPTHTKNGEQYDSLQVTSNDPDQPTMAVNLAGLNSANYEGNNEPSVAEIARTFGFSFDVGTEDNILGGSKALLGDEVYSPYWLRADTAKNVELWPLAVYSGRGNPSHDSIKFEAKPSSGGRSGTVYSLAGRDNDDSATGTEVKGSNDLSGGENQKLLPKILVGGVNSTPTSTTVDFNPTTAFALNRGGAYTDDSRNGTEQLHNWRVFPVGDLDTTTTWFAAVDPGNVEGFPKNYDYNDDVYLLVNAKPEFATTLAFDAANFSVNEAGLEAEITVVRSGNTNSAVSAFVTPGDGTAKAPGDYSNSPVQVNFASGELEATVRIPIGEDDLEEGSETINLALGNFTGNATAGPQNTTVLSILDNDQTSFTTVNWSTTGAKPSPIGRSESVGAVANGKLYVLGGYLDSTFKPTDRSDVYNPTDKSWTSIAPLLTPLSHGATAVDETLDADGTDIYLAGGYVGTPTGQVFATTDVWKYNVNANTWDNTLPELPQARGSGALELLGRDLHFFGGADINRADKGDHWVLNLDGGTSWTPAASLPNPRSHLGDATLGGKIYAIGGQHGVDDNLVTQNSVHVWDPATPNVWTALAPLPEGRSHIGASTFVMGDRIIVAGGETRHGSGGTVPDVTAYKPQFDFWTALTPLPAPRHSGVAGSIGGNVFYTTGAPGFRTTTYKGTPA